MKLLREGKNVLAITSPLNSLLSLLQSNITLVTTEEFSKNDSCYILYFFSINQVKISQLEAVTKADVLEKNELLDKLSQERGYIFIQLLCFEVCMLWICFKFINVSYFDVSIE